jgi:phospho-N-acetylmuramoyl-pentapeptide-transferase
MNNTTLVLSLAALAFMMTVIWGGPLLRILRYFKVGKLIRVEEPGKHISKMGTPTMGGVMIILPVALITVMLNAASLIGMRILGQSVLVPLLVLVAYGSLGALDDWEGIRGKRQGQGMRIRTKLFIQILLALGIACVLKFLLQVPNLYLPGIQGEINISAWVYIPVAAFIIVGASNAVNFTDGLDGLAGLISATIFAAYGVVALLQ